MKLNKLRNKAYRTAINHGWHEQELSNEHCLCLVISELMEAVEADRKNKHADIDVFNYIIQDTLHQPQLSDQELKSAYTDAFSTYIKDTVEDEMSDACIRLFDYAGLKNIDLDDYDYKGSDTEDYTELTFTESMFCIIKYITDGFYQYEPQIILNEIFAFCKSRNIAIMWHIKKKMMFNTLREYRHGKKAY